MNLRIALAALAAASALAVQASPNAPAPAAAPGVGKIAKAAGADAKTVAEVFETRAALKDKSVSVRGKVVKVNSGIMGKNWVHLQDGTGSAAKGTHDLIVTTQENAAVGDVVTAKGLVRTDVSLGSGYAYEVLVEEAKLRK